MDLTGDSSIDHETKTTPDNHKKNLNSSQHYNFFGITRNNSENAMFSTFLLPPMYDQFGIRQPILMCQVISNILYSYSFSYSDNSFIILSNFIRLMDHLL